MDGWEGMDRTDRQTDGQTDGWVETNAWMEK